MTEVLLTKAEAARRLSVSLATVDRMLKTGRLVAVRVGVRRVGIPESSVGQIINSNSEAK